MTRAAAALAAGMLAVLALSACETTQQESARIARQLGHQRANPGTTQIGAANDAVRVVRTALVPGSPAAAAIELTNTSASAESAIPVAIAAHDAHGAVVYRNDTRGIETSIQQLALLPAHATAWWVDNEVLAAGSAAASVDARVGAGSGAAPRGRPAISVRGVSASDSFPGPHVDLTVHNGGWAAQSQLAVYAVALRGGRVVGAGRALVASLAAGASAPVLIPMAGAVTGATISVTAAGTAT
jgi:hypothetical protein